MNGNISKNVLITFDVKIAGKCEWQRFKTNEIFYDDFDDVIELNRKYVPSVRNIFQYYSYCKSRRDEFFEVVNQHLDVNTIYFFADDEIDIQILVDLFKKRVGNSLQCVLVDEGLVTYSSLDHRATLRQRLFYSVFPFFAGFRFYNFSGTYGDSNLYNISLANKPEKARYFKPPIRFLPPLSDETLNKVRSRIGEDESIKCDAMYFLYIGTHEKSVDADISVMLKLKSILDKHAIPFFIKLHPQQNQDLYSRHFDRHCFINQGYPIELFFGNNAIIAGTVSSCLFNASMQGYKVLDIYHLFDETEIVSLGEKRMIGITDEYDWINIVAIDSYEEFEKRIINYLN